jgi:hypothetical protein
LNQPLQIPNLSKQTCLKRKSLSLLNLPVLGKSLSALRECDARLVETSSVAIEVNRHYQKKFAQGTGGSSNWPSQRPIVKMGAFRGTPAAVALWATRFARASTSTPRFAQ